MGTGNGEGAQLSPGPTTEFTDAMVLAWLSSHVAILRLWIRSSLYNYSTCLIRVKTVYHTKLELPPRSRHRTFLA